MSARNGDKARFGKNRRRKIAQRVRDRALRRGNSHKPLKSLAPSADK